MGYSADNLRLLKEQLKEIRGVLLSFLRDYEHFFESDVGMAKLISGPSSRRELGDRIETIKKVLGVLDDTLKRT